MQVVVYSNQDAPVGFQHIAHIVADQPNVGKPGVKLGFHPVVFRAATPEAAAADAQKRWDDELAKATAMLGVFSDRAKRAAETRAKTKAANA